MPGIRSGAASVPALSIRAKTQPLWPPGNYANLPQRRIKFLGMMRHPVPWKAARSGASPEISPHRFPSNAPPQISELQTFGRRGILPDAVRVDPPSPEVSIRRLFPVHAGSRASGHSITPESFVTVHSGASRWLNNTLGSSRMGGFGFSLHTPTRIGRSRWVGFSIRLVVSLLGPMQPVAHRSPSERRAKSREHRHSRRWPRTRCPGSIFPACLGTYHVVPKRFLRREVLLVRATDYQQPLKSGFPLRRLAAILFFCMYCREKSDAREQGAVRFEQTRAGRNCVQKCLHAALCVILQTLRKAQSACLRSTKYYGIEIRSLASMALRRYADFLLFSPASFPILNPFSSSPEEHFHRERLLSAAAIFCEFLKSLPA